MKKRYLILIPFIAVMAYAAPQIFRELQVGFGTIDSSSIFDVFSTTKGTRPYPSMTEAQRDLIGTPATGLTIINTDTNKINYYSGTAWLELASLSGSEVITNKDIDGGTASNTNRITLPKDTSTNLDLLTDKEGTIAWDTTLGSLVGNDGTGWSQISGSGGGSGFKNYIENGDIEGGTTGFTTYDDGASYVDGTGGSPTSLTISANATTPLEGSLDLQISKAAVDCTGEGVSVLTTTIDRQDRGKKLNGKINFDFTNANYTSDDFKIHAYDVTNSTELLVLEENNGAIRAVQSAIQFQVFPSSTTQQVRLSIHCTVDSNPGVTSTLFIDDVFLGPESFSPGSILSKDISFTPTANWVSNITWTGQWHREGSHAYIRYNAELSNTSEATALIIDLPPGLVIDTTALNRSSAPFRLEGSFTTREAGVGEQLDVYPRYNSTTTFRLGIDNATGTYTQSGSTVTNTVPFSWAAGDYLHGYIKVPIVGWEASNLVSTTETLFDSTKSRMYVNSTQTVTASTAVEVDFDTISYDNNNIINLTNNDATVPVSAKYNIYGQLQISGLGANEVFFLRVAVNGSTRIFHATTAPSSAGASFTVPFTDTIDLNQSDVINVTVDSAVDTSYSVAGGSNASFIVINKDPDFSTFGVFGETEVIESASAGTVAYAPTLSQWGDHTSILLPIGEFRIDLKISTITTGITAGSIMCLGTSSTAGNTAPGTEGDDYICSTLQGTGRDSISNYTENIIVTTPTTYYLKTFYNTGVGSTSIGYRITARRIK